VTVQIADSDQPLHQFKAIFNPKSCYIFGPKKVRLLLFDKHLTFERRENPLKIPYDSIKSIWMEKNKAFLTWGDETISFGIASYISRSAVDLLLTTKVVNLISQIKAEDNILREAHPELTLKKIKTEKRKLFVKLVVFVIVTSVIGTIFFDKLLSKPLLLLFGFICWLVIFATLFRPRGPAQ